MDAGHRIPLEVYTHLIACFIENSSPIIMEIFLIFYFGPYHGAFESGQRVSP
jgi:hypothetical protein